MQQRPSETDAVAVRELAATECPSPWKRMPGKHEALSLGQDDPDSIGSGDGVGHESFTAGFVDGRAIAVGNHDAKASGAGGNGELRDLRSTADYENICV